MREIPERAKERAALPVRGPAARALLFFGIVVAIMIAAVTGYEIVVQRQAALERVRSEMGGINVALAEHTERIIAAVDAVVADIVRDRAGAESGGGHAASAASHRLLHDHATGLPMLTALISTDAAGRLLAHSTVDPAPAIAVSDRPYFLQLRDNPGSGAYFSEPLVGRVTQQPEIVMARAIVDADGAFRGIVAAGLDVAYFADFYRDVMNFGGGAATLYRSDGMPLARYPASGSGQVAAPPAMVGDLPAEAASGIASMRDARDGRLHLVSYRRIDGYPLLVLISLDEQSVLAHWRASAARLGATAILGIILMWLLIATILRRLGIEELQARRLAQSEEQFRVMVERASDALLLYDLDGRIVMVNQMACATLGYNCAELTGRDMGIVVAAGDANTVEPWWRCLAVDAPVTRETEYRRKDGSTFPVEVRLGAFDMGERRLILALARDISERKAWQARLEQQANYDLLTGLPNRLLFLDRLNTALAAARRNARLLALLFLDLDGFKKINDTLGHAAGDSLLVEAGRRIGAVLRETDTVARYGGDEFVVLLPELESAADAEHVADKIAETFLEPINLVGKPVHIRASIGVAIYPADADDVDALLCCADADMYLAKGVAAPATHQPRG